MMTKASGDPRQLAFAAFGKDPDWTSDARVKEAFELAKQQAMADFGAIGYNKWGGWQPEPTEVGVRYLMPVDVGLSLATYRNRWYIASGSGAAGWSTTPWISLTTTNLEYKQLLIVGVADYMATASKEVWGYKFTVNAVEYPGVYDFVNYAKHATVDTPVEIFDTPILVPRKSTLTVDYLTDAALGADNTIQLIGYIFAPQSEIITGE